MDVDDFLEYLETLPRIEDYIVRIKIKYIGDKDYTYLNEILLVNIEQPTMFIWENDWDECIEESEVVGYIAIADIKEFKTIGDSDGK